MQLERLLPLSRYHWPAWSLPNGGWGKAQWAASEGAGARVGPVGRRQRQQGRATSADLQVVLHNMERWFAVVGTTDQYVDRCGFDWRVGVEGQGFSNGQRESHNGPDT